MMTRESTIELHRPDMKFSAGHFTIFSDTEREPLHGHNYTVYLALTTTMESEIGLNFDYRYYRKKILNLCQTVHQTFLLPQHSPYVTYSQDDHYHYVHFSNEKIPFLERDITFLPVTNISVEELSKWFINQLTEDKHLLDEHQIKRVLIKIFSTPGQCASSEWHCE